MTSFWKKFFSAAAISLIVLSPVFSKKKKADSSVPVLEEDYQADLSETTKLALPEVEEKDRSFFAGVDKSILDNVEIGSPDSLLAAIASMKRQSDSASDAEKILFNTALSILKICWHSVQTSENYLPVSPDDSYSAAIESARKGIYDFNSGNSDFLTCALPSLVLAVSESRNDYFEEAENSLKRCLEEREDSVFVNYLYGILCRRQLRYEEAAARFEKASVSAPSCFEIQYNLAEALFGARRYQDSFELAEKLLAENPANKNLLKLCANSAFNADNISKAENYVNRVLQSEPENAAFVLFRIKILVARGEYIRAASLLDAYARTDSSSRDYLYLRFKIQKEWNKNVTAATSTIEKALELYPDDEEIVISAAEMASESNVSINGWAGEELAEQILEKDPSNYKAQKIKIQSMIQKKNWAEAYKASTMLLRHPLSQDDALYTHIKICLSAGKKEEAWHMASDLYSRKPGDENVLQSYIDVLVSTSRKNEAVKIISQLLPGASAKMKSFLYYERSFLSTDENTILTDLRSSLTANPRNKDALFRLYSIYFGKKEYKKAQYYLKQVVALSPKDESLLNLNKQLEKLIAQ